MLFHLKILFRKLRLDGLYSFINIGGLTIGMVAAMIIMLWVYNQWSYDRFHTKDKYLYKVWCYDETNGNFSNVSLSLGPSLLNEYAGFANMSRYGEQEVRFNFTIEDGSNLQISTGNENSAIFATVDSSFLDMFSFPLVRGDVRTALKEPHSTLLTEKFAKRFFGDKDPETFFFNGYPIKISGILADLPENSRFKFDMLNLYNGAADESWFYPSGSNTWTYIELSPEVDVKTISASIRDIVPKHTDGRTKSETYLQHISKWHLYNKVEKGVSVGGRIETLRMFALIALLILIIACINFMNLSTAQSSKYAQEVGVRKVMGANRSSLIFRFLSESTLIAAIAGLIALYIVIICLPYFNAIVGENINLNPNNEIFWIAGAVFVVFTGLLAGSYPSFYLSSFLPVKVLKGVFKAGNGLVTPRKALIVTQFTFAIILIAFTWVVHRQINYAQARDTGYDKTRLVSFQINSDTRHTRELIRRELLESGVAEAVSNNFASMINSESKWTDHVRWRGKDPENHITFERNYAEADWAKTTGVQIIQGRDIDVHKYPADSTAILLNETAVKIMGFDDPIGETVYEWSTQYHIVGVVKDFVLESPYESVRPMLIGGPANGWFNNINVKLSAQGSFSENLTKMVQIFKKYNPNNECLYRIVDEVYAQHFDKEQRIGSLVNWFAGLAIFISCMGLFGLSAYMAENRRKEIGIRKVLGASVFDVTSLLSKEFLILVSISLVIAIPVSLLIINRWLSDYAYRTNIPWWLMVSVAFLTIGIALVTVSFQAIKTAMGNPVESIKRE